ncbi:STAS domain-containing protein [Streptomyces sp. NPDC004111]|uniref:STAS domain-containing protein n=1 Tax=Streptomyces sp. NPDC004111 TaxID=3364690 RepID=UPI00368DF84F
MSQSAAEQPVRLRRAGDVLVVTLAGELDLFMALQCGPPIDRALIARPGRTVADLSGVTFIDCSGLALLLRMRRRAARWGGEFAICSPDRGLLRILRYVEVGEPLAFVDSLPDGGEEPGIPAWMHSLR